MLIKLNLSRFKNHGRHSIKRARSILPEPKSIILCPPGSQKILEKEGNEFNIVFET